MPTNQEPTTTQPQQPNRQPNNQPNDQQAQEDAQRQASLQQNERQQGTPVEVVNDLGPSEAPAREVEYLPDTYIVKFKTYSDTSRRLLPDFDKSQESVSDYVASLQRMSNTPREEERNMDQQIAVHRTMTRNIIQNDVREVRKLFVSTTSDEVANTYVLGVGAARQAQVFEQLQADPNVEYIERVPMYKVDVNDTYANPSSMRYLSKVEADKAWAA